jgi:hypothetical protein
VLAEDDTPVFSPGRKVTHPRIEHTFSVLDDNKFEWVERFTLPVTPETNYTWVDTIFDAWLDLDSGVVQRAGCHCQYWRDTNTEDCYTTGPATVSTKNTKWATEVTCTFTLPTGGVRRIADGDGIAAGIGGQVWNFPLPVGFMGPSTG